MMRAREAAAGSWQLPLLGQGVAALARAWPGGDVVDGKATVLQRWLQGVAALARAWSGDEVVDGEPTVLQRRLRGVAAPGCLWRADESSAFPDFKADDSSALHRMSRFEP